MALNLDDISKEGIKNNAVYWGDCLEVMQHLPDESVDLILCDLPYGVLSRAGWDKIIPFEELWGHYKRVIRQGRAIVLFSSQPFTTALINSNPDWFKYEIIWLKEQTKQPWLANKRPMKAHENILIFYGKNHLYNPQFSKGKPYNKKSKVEKETVHCRSIFVSNEKKNEDKRYPLSYILWPTETGKEHPTKKPVGLFEYLIRTYSNEGDVVLDNAAGSGTTAIAALRSNRQYILIEKEESFVNVIETRLGNYQPNLNFEEPSEQRRVQRRVRRYVKAS